MTDQERDPEATGPEGAAEPAPEPVPEPATPDEIEPEEDVETLADAPGEDQDVTDELPVAATTTAAAAARKKGAASKGAPAAAPSVAQEAVHVQDRASAWFVIITVGVFVAILGYGLLFGHNGLVSGMLATPKPVATVPASVEPSVAPSVAPSVEPSTAPSDAPASASPAAS
jgi:hypothetical protein